MATAPPIAKQNRFGVSRKYVQSANAQDHRAVGTPEQLAADARTMQQRWEQARVRANAARNKK